MLSFNNKARNLYFLKKKRFNVPKLDIFKSTEFINIDNEEDLENNCSDFLK